VIEALAQKTIEALAQKATEALAQKVIEAFAQKDNRKYHIGCLQEKFRL
jgi:hypothetical protein